MFAVLQTEELKTGFFEWLKERRYPSKVTCDTVRTNSGILFFVINASVKRGKIPWDEIAYASGKCARRMLFPENILPPENSILESYKPRGILKYHMLFNTACEILKRAQLDPSKMSICIVDKDADLIEKVDKILNFASEIRIVTDKEEEYANKADELLKKFGASIIINKDILSANQSDIVILNDEEISADNKIVFAVKGRKTYISPPKIFLTSEYDNIRPDNIDEELFGNALYELCKVRDLENNSFEKLIFNGESITIYKLAQELKTLNS